MAVDIERQTSARGPAQPSYVFRGHTAQIHSAQIVRHNTCLITGDADGWVVCWRLESKRPVAVWQAHEGAILGTAEWGPDRLITHGRDHTLRVWKFGATDASTLSTVLPADGSTMHRPKPWLLHSLPVNTLNFCALSVCHEKHASDLQSSGTASKVQPNRSGEPILVAVPARDDKKIEVYQFPDEKLVAVVQRVEPTDTGMVMAVKLVHHSPSRNTLVVAGYEGGFTAVHLLPRNPATDLDPTRKPILTIARTIYLSQPHTQPILSLDALSDGTTYFTSSADAIIAAHRIPELPFLDDVEELPLVTADTTIDVPESASHAAASPREHEVPDPTRLSASAQADASVPEDTSPGPMEFPKRPVAPDINPSPLTFSKQSVSPSSFQSAPTTQPAGLKSLLSSAPPQLRKKLSMSSLPTVTTAQPPSKSVRTKHAGQQSLRVRSDGRLFVTGGWDSRVRIYSAKTLKEMAVLKWHKEGVYAVDFGEILEPENLTVERDGASRADYTEDAMVAKRETGLSRLQRQREKQMQLKHWVVAGSKDGKVSLWEVF